MNSEETGPAGHDASVTIYDENYAFSEQDDSITIWRHRSRSEQVLCSKEG